MESITVHLPDPDATKQIASDIALAVKPGDTLWLIGDLGAGKSEFARAFIRTLCEDEQLEVPSPTFSLVQSYEFARGGKEIEILHADLHRITDPAEVNELGLSETDETDDRILLVEWPQMGGGELCRPDIQVELSDPDTPNGRDMVISGPEETIERVKRSFLIRDFLDRNWNGSVSRHFLLGDASARSYETVASIGDNRILMNAPRQPDGPVLKSHGKPYSRIAHLAEDISAFAGMQKILFGYNLSVPKIHAMDLDAGLMLLEDLGRETVLDAACRPDPERYRASIDALVHMHAQPVTEKVEIAPGRQHHIPPYDRQALEIETSLMPDWYASRMLGRKLTETERQDFEGIWHELISKLETAEKHIVLRDFHSPNIIWLSGRSGYARAGLIDFQDAVIGPVAYDVASLAQDARVDVDEKLEAGLLDHYIESRQHLPGFDIAGFKMQYAIMAAQRATKILGIFVRLDERDGKPAYLAHLPRMQDYIRRSMRHPALAAYRKWFESVTSM